MCQHYVTGEEMTDKMTNEELVKRLRNWDECSQDDYNEAADRIERMSKFLRHNVFPEKLFGVFFICGEAGEKDSNGIPERIHICPAYGSDVSYVFTRGKSFAPEW
jgi:hypothetical protein